MIPEPKISFYLYFLFWFSALRCAKWWIGSSSISSLPVPSNMLIQWDPTARCSLVTCLTFFDSLDFIMSKRILFPSLSYKLVPSAFPSMLPPRSTVFSWLLSAILKWTASRFLNTFYFFCLFLYSVRQFLMNSPTFSSSFIASRGPSESYLN